MKTPMPAEAFDHGDARRYRRGCHCTACTTAVRKEAERNKFLRETGRGIFRSGNAAGAHIHAMRATGMADKHIQQAARICPDVMYRIMRGDSQIHVTTERRILAVTAPPTGRPQNSVKTDGTGTRRRLRALVVAGWPGAELGRRMGATKEYIGHLLHGRGAGQVAIHTAIRVKALYLELWDQRPEDHGVQAHMALRARLLAARRGWHPAAVWDDMNDPNEQPQYGEDVPRPVAIVENTAELARQGLSREAIAERLGVTWNTVTVAHSRAGVPVPGLAA